MMMTFITQRGESQGKTKKERKATKSKGRGLEEMMMMKRDDDDDVYYPKGRKPREDEKGEESYEKQRQRPGARRALMRQYGEEGCGERG